MKIPRDLSGITLAKALSRIGYRVARQTGSHIRLTTETPSRHRITIPAHKPLKVGTLSAILADVGVHQELDREELLRQLFGRTHDNH